ncbi:MAG: protein kinase [Burkholderiales bacterium]|nr:protein kinase [Burkholderiales bacterium]
MPKGGHVCENALPAGTRLAEFEILGLVGEGGFGIVYLAHDEVLQRRVALKEYLPSSLANRGANLSVRVGSARDEETFQLGLRSFLNEARLLAQFDHQALVKVYRFWEANGTAYMVMPFYDAPTFKQTIQRSGRLDEPALTTLLHQLLDALAVLHGAGCIHRDVAPDNVLMLASNRPVLLDFGASRRVITDRTQQLTVILKPGYAPIEQYAEIAGLKQGPWTDLYALAGMAHFAITGSPPPQAIARTMTDPYMPLEQAAAGRYSARFLRAIDRALSVKPEGRPQNTTEFHSLLGDGPAVAVVAKPRKKVPALAWVGGGVALAIAAGAGLVLYNNNEPAVAQAPAPSPAPTVPVPVALPPEPAPVPQAILAPEPVATVATVPVEPKVVKPPAPRRPVVSRPPAPTQPREAPAPEAANQMAALAAAALFDGEKCLRSKEYSCAIANANSALRAEPTSVRAKRLKEAAEEAQRRALSQIRID